MGPVQYIFSFAGVGAEKLTAAACTQNESHFKLLTQAPQQRGSHYEPGKATTTTGPVQRSSEGAAA